MTLTLRPTFIDSGAYYAYGMNDYDGFTAPPSLTIPEARCWVKLEHVSK